VERCAVAFVLVKRILWMQLVIKRHQAIAQHLGHNGRATNHVTALVAMHDRPTRKCKRGNIQPIHEDKLGRRGEIANRVRHGGERRAENILGVNLLRADDAEAHVGVLQDQIEGAYPLRAGETFRIVDADG